MFATRMLVLPGAIRAAATVLLAAQAAGQSIAQFQTLPYCPPSVRDDATGGCLRASSDPTLNMLYPLSRPLFVDPVGVDLAGELTGNVGMGTTTPSAQLEIVGNLGQVLTGTVSIDSGSTTVTGTGTSFDSQLLRGAALGIGGEVFTITDVLSPTWIEVTPAAASSHTGVPAHTDGDLFAITTAAQKRLMTMTNWGHLYIGDPIAPQMERISVFTSDVGLVVASRNPRSPTLAEILYGTLRKDSLAANDRAQIALGFFANDDGMGDPDRRFFAYLEAVVEDPDNATKSAGLRFMTPSSGNNFPAERMRITGAGNVGIGTSNPTSKLHVVGDVTITGNLSKGSGSFRIDHPLDPKNKYLSHSFVESPDMMNLYNGNIVLDENGMAWVTLPEWFGALNGDFRYQLTCVGGFAPVYVAEEIAENRFRIAGGTPGLKVSWQVSGIRHDAYARMHRVPVEEAKPAHERGTYLHPDVFAASGPSRP